MSGPVHLRSYNNSWYSPGRSNLWRAAWMFLGQPLFATPYLPSSGLRVRLLRIFGAQVGCGVVIHSEVKVKYPWHLVVGDDCWIGEEVWIDNLTTVRFANNVCVSQGAYLCTGNHDWSDPAFGLIVRGIELKEGAWAGAKCVLLPGARLGVAAVASAGSVVSRAIPDFEVHAGNPASYLRTRHIRESNPAQRQVEKVAV
jgi:putative colanic acid biosynthesis acetyltransferase WcaF